MLTDALQKAGVTAAFSRDADFSRLSDTRLMISDVVHTVSCCLSHCSLPCLACLSQHCSVCACA
jgi:hypothetical protein